MDFVSFCRLHGLLIDYLPPIGVWKRYPTEDHPKKRNGAAKYMGTHGFVQNHAIETAVSVWKSDDPSVNVAQVRRDSSAAHRRMILDQERAAEKAQWILNQCVLAEHDYLVAKGFPKEVGNVWLRPDGPLLVIPMRVGADLVGCQLINASGEKKFLKGQRTAGASLCFDKRGPVILCEGYATALSVRAAFSKLNRPFCIHVCFSASNLKAMSRRMIPGLVVADNDVSGAGEDAARESGWPYWMSDTVGEDANDAHRRLGLFRFSQALQRALFTKSAPPPAPPEMRTLSPRPRLSV